MHTHTIYINGDGGSRGNPGPAASAISVTQNGKEIYRASKYLGIETNNGAEYTCVLLGLSWVRDNLSDKTIPVVFQLDSELVAKHIRGEYKVRSPKLLPYYNQVMAILSAIPNEVVFTNVPREQNAIADLYVNQELDSHSSR